MQLNLLILAFGIWAILRINFSNCTKTLGTCSRIADLIYSRKFRTFRHVRMFLVFVAMIREKGLTIRIQGLNIGKPVS